MGSEQIIGGFFALIALLIFLPVFAAIIQMATDTQCQNYKQILQQKDAEISGLNEEIEKWKNSYNELNNNYQKLITENITKQDIEDIKTQAAVTQGQISNVEQRIEILNQSYTTNYTKIQNSYYISIIFSVGLAFFLTIDLLSVAFFKLDIKLFAFKIFWGVTYGLIILNIWHGIPIKYRERVPKGIVDSIRGVADRIENAGKNMT